MKRILIAMLGLVMTSGCVTMPNNLSDLLSIPGNRASWLVDLLSKGDDSPDPDAEAVGESPVPADEIPADKITWLGPNISNWEIVERLSVTIHDTAITLNQDSSGNLGKRYIHGKWLSGNPWIFILQEDGTYFAATWEWLKHGQHTKEKSAVAGDHIKKAPAIPMDWKPTVGVKYGFAVSGLARDSNRNIEERTNIVLVKWK